MKISVNFGTLFLIFLILKLTEVITWSWWWVTAPLWIPLVAYLVFLFITAWVVAGSGVKPAPKRRHR